MDLTMSQNTTPVNKVTVSTGQKQAAADAAILPSEVISDDAILGGNALPQDSFGDADTFLQAKNVTEAVTLKDAEPKIAVVKKESAPESIDAAFDNATEDSIIEAVAANVLEEANAAVAESVVSEQEVADANEELPVSEFEADQAQTESEIAQEVEVFIREPQGAIVQEDDLYDEDSDDSDSVVGEVLGDKCVDPYAIGSYRYALNDNMTLANYLLGLSAIGLTVTHVSEVGINRLIGFPVSAYTGVDSTDVTDGALRLQRVSFKTALPEFEDEDHIHAILNEMNRLKADLNCNAMDAFIYISESYEELDGDAFVDLKAAYDNRDIVMLSTLTIEEIENLSGHEMLFVVMPVQGHSYTANTINLRYIGDPNSDFHYTEEFTEEMISPSLKVFGNWLKYLQRNGLAVIVPEFSVDYHERGEDIIWTESLNFTVIGHESLVSQLINPVFGGEKLLSNLNLNAEYEVGRFESCAITLGKPTAYGTLGSRFNVTLVATHTNANEYELHAE